MDYNKGTGGRKGRGEVISVASMGQKGAALYQSVRYFSSHQLVLRRWQLVQFGASRWPVVRAFFPSSPSTRTRAMPTDDDDRNGRAETIFFFRRRIRCGCTYVRYIRVINRQHFKRRVGYAKVQ